MQKKSNCGFEIVRWVLCTGKITSWYWSWLYDLQVSCCDFNEMIGCRCSIATRGDFPVYQVSQSVQPCRTKGSPVLYQFPGFFYGRYSGTSETRLKRSVSLEGERKPCVCPAHCRVKALLTGTRLRISVRSCYDNLSLKYTYRLWSLDDVNGDNVWSHKRQPIARL